MQSNRELYSGDVVNSLHTKFYCLQVRWVLDYFSIFFVLHQMTPLHLVAESGCIKIVKYLIEQRADVNNQDNDGVIICYTNVGI